MNVMGQDVAPLDLIQHHVDNLAALWRGEPVRDLAESAAGYAAALAHLRGSVVVDDAAVERVAVKLCELQGYHSGPMEMDRRTARLLLDAARETR